jgi:peroxisomal 2,4-dienoyl-CoA reductase
MTSIFKDDCLAGRVALVTGGGSGICKGITRSLLAHGAKATIVGRKKERLDAAAEELAKETGSECLAAAADVRETEQVEGAVDACVERFGKLDLLVNGAAGNFLAPASQLSYNAFRTVMEIDAIGTYNVSKAAFDKAMKDGGGVILNISATLHHGATPLQTHASAAKAAVDSITRSLAAEWGSLGIRVVGIAPGPIGDTEGVSRLVPQGMKEKIEKGIPLGRFGTIAEIASLATFLCTDAAALITGDTIISDGGQFLLGSGVLVA